MESKNEGNVKKEDENTFSEKPPKKLKMRVGAWVLRESKSSIKNAKEILGIEFFMVKAGSMRTTIQYY
jgi:hypothetical protein